MNPRVRGDLDIITIRDGQFVLSDGRGEAGFVLTASERYLCGLLDGTRAPGEILDRYRERFEEPLSSRNLEEFVEQLRVHRLLDEGDGTAVPGQIREAPVLARTPARLDRTAGRPRGTSEEPHERQARASRLNRRLDILLLVFGWLIHPIWCVPIALGAIAAGSALLGNLGLYQDEILRLVLALPLPILVYVLALRVFVVDLAGTLAQAMVLRKHGARIQGFGLELHRWVLPVFRCDAGSSVSRLDERGRTGWLASRIWVELALGSIAVLSWLQSEEGTLGRALGLLVTIPVLFGLALKVNPLIRLDAYRILARTLERPRLYEEARAEVSAWVLGRVGPEPLGGQERVLLRLYGLASYAWQFAFNLVVIIGGMWLHTELYGRAGAYWWTLLLALWYGPSVRDGASRTFAAVPGSDRWLRGGGAWYVRWSVRLLVIGLLVLVLFIPYDHEIVGEARLVPGAEQGVRAQVSDEIAEVLVAEGDTVARGDVLARLSAREVVAAIAEAEADLARAEANLAKLEAGPRAEDVEIARHEVDRLESELRYHEVELARQTRLFEEQTVSRDVLDGARRLHGNAVQRLALAASQLDLLEEGTREEEIVAARARVAFYRAQLEKGRRDLALTDLRAPISGRVSTPNLASRVGQVAEKGDLVVVVQDTSDLRVEIVAPEEAAVWVMPGMEARVRLRALDGDLLAARVESVGQFVSREESVDPPPFRSDREQLTEDVRERDAGEYRVRVVARLEERREPLGRTLVGMTGEARIVVDRSTLGMALLRPVLRFVRTEVWSWLP